eukprot:TRINITY_DN2220_c0_g2_i2.p1 TRINITY_DN2220_c0_g2~~TRINITY_DN2220_c0_g2_i2.p1  ORF type:complete len:143 (+),score=19.02 TRINITY_DN2220_c0_g2_i2:96-524(+)
MIGNGERRNMKPQVQQRDLVVVVVVVVIIASSFVLLADGQSSHGVEDDCLCSDGNYLETPFCDRLKNVAGKNVTGNCCFRNETLACVCPPLGLPDFVHFTKCASFYPTEGCLCESEAKTRSGSIPLLLVLVTLLCLISKLFS